MLNCHINSEEQNEKWDWYIYYQPILTLTTTSLHLLHIQILLAIITGKSWWLKSCRHIHCFHGQSIMDDVVHGRMAPTASTHLKLTSTFSPHTMVALTETTHSRVPRWSPTSSLGKSLLMTERECSQVLESLVLNANRHASSICMIHSPLHKLAHCSQSP